jgi:hypothetical protein
MTRADFEDATQLALPIALLCAGALAVGMWEWAHTMPASEETLRPCARIADDPARLACYDTLAAPLPAKGAKPPSVHM